MKEGRTKMFVRLYFPSKAHHRTTENMATESKIPLLQQERPHAHLGEPTQLLSSLQPYQAEAGSACSPQPQTAGLGEQGAGPASLGPHEGGQRQRTKEARG
jgi:hypothetical protein